MHLPNTGRLYYEAWLRRMRRHFAASGRLSQTAILLARSRGDSAEVWSRRLRALLDGREAPTVELITRIDALLTPAASRSDPSAQGVLFD